MQRSKHTSPLSIFLVLCLLGLLAVATACSGTQNHVEPAIEATAATEVPAGVTTAREAVLEFLRSDANCVVPPAGARWTAEAGQAPDNFAVYRFHSDECLVTVSYPLKGETRGYHVGLTNKSTGFCWQANVDAQGKVVNTGAAAELIPELADAAASYCEQGGNQYTVEEQPDGTHCGICTFPDGSHCKAWLYYQGECAPSES
jgi:putative hemolysin